MAQSSHLPQKSAVTAKARLGSGNGSSQTPPSAIAESCRPATPSDDVLAAHFKQLRLPKFRREYERVARECAQAGVDYRGYLLQLAELEVTDRQRRGVARRIRNACFPAITSLDTCDIAAIPGRNISLLSELMSCDFVRAGENVILLGTNASAKTRLATAIGVAACQRGFLVAFVTAADLARQLEQARRGRRLVRLLRRLAAVNLLIVDNLGEMPLSQTGVDLLFEVFSQRHERCSTIVISKLPVEEWISVFGREPLTGALIDRLTHHVHTVEIQAADRPTVSHPPRRVRLLDDAGRIADPQSHEFLRTPPSRPLRQPPGATGWPRQLELVGA